jgi:hypothetical protein
MFTSSTDLHIDLLALVQSKGVAIPGYSVDFDGDSRIDPPDMGADEVIIPVPDLPRIHLLSII